MKLFKNKSFTLKMIAVFIVILLLPMITVSMLSRRAYRQTLEEKTNDYMRNLAAVTMSKVENSVMNIENTGFFIVGSDTVQKTVKSEGKAASDQRIDHAFFSEYLKTRSLMADYSLLRSEIVSMYIHSGSGRVYGYSKSKRMVDFDAILGSPDTDKKDWIVADGRIFMVRKMFSFPLKDEYGEFVMEIDPSTFYSIISNIDYSGSGQVFLVDSENRIVAAQDKARTGDQLPDTYTDSSASGGESFKTVVLDGKGYIVYTGTAIENGWKMVLAVPQEYYMRDISRLNDRMTIIILTVCLGAVFLTVVVCNGVTSPLKKLSDAMEEAGQGNLDVNCVVESGDEIGALSRTFNQMLADMKRLINSEYEQKVLRQNAEMKSLQMQINPHFLYNTLDTINWMARAGGLDDVGDMTSALGSLMRYSLSKKDIVSVQEEIESLRNYVKIQDVRYGDKMTVVFDIADDILLCGIPKLIIQPILENAIVHGVEDKLEASRITVKGFAEQEDLYLIVEDDGIGMTQGTIERILDDNCPPEKGHTSIGVNNVNRRIQMVFGKRYGLQIQSILGAGTKITLHMRTGLKI